MKEAQAWVVCLDACFLGWLLRGFIVVVVPSTSFAGGLLYTYFHTRYEYGSLRVHSGQARVSIWDTLSTLEYMHAYCMDIDLS